MNLWDKKESRRRLLKWGAILGLVVGLPLAITMFLWSVTVEAPAPDPQFFARRYPASLPLQEELTYIRKLNKVSRADEVLISQSIQRTSPVFRIPPALLWCLFFQESRLNHLLGIYGERPSHGLGQFTHFGFYEINYDLERFNLVAKSAMTRLLGSDVRPVRPDKNNIFNASSYYYIPTAVVTSATFLRNRYLQLHRALRRQDYSYDPDVLWLFAIMAYNKGARSVLNFWSDYQQSEGSHSLQKLLLNKSTFLASLSGPLAYEKSLRKIWQPGQAKAYANELAIHLKNITSCAIPPQQLNKAGRPK